MNLGTKLSDFWRRLLGELFPALTEEVGPLLGTHRRFVAALDLVGVWRAFSARRGAVRVVLRRTAALLRGLFWPRPCGTYQNSCVPPDPAALPVRDRVLAGLDPRHDQRRRRRASSGVTTPWRATVTRLPFRRPRKLKLAPVKGFRKREIARGAKRWLAPGSEVLTDGLRCWNALHGIAGSHRAIRTGSGRQAARMAPFKWVNTTLGNIKSAITGTYRKLGPDHAERYLASFAWRYNRRFQLQAMIPRFVHSAARTQPIPYRNLIAG